MFDKVDNQRKAIDEYHLLPLSATGERCVEEKKTQENHTKKNFYCGQIEKKTVPGKSLEPSLF